MTTLLPDAAELPGYRVVSASPPATEEDLRNDVAGFLGTTARGPLNLPVRTTTAQQLASEFGTDGPTVRAVQAFYANGGQVAWVVRLGAGGTTASGQLTFGAATSGRWDDAGPTRLTLGGTRLTLHATSPGAWATGLRVLIDYRAYGFAGATEMDVAVLPPNEPARYHVGLAPAELVGALERSGHLRARLDDEAVVADAARTNRGPASLRWEVTLVGGADPIASVESYLVAATAVGDVAEVALVAAPGLERDLAAGDDERVITALVTDAVAAQDRLVVLAAPDVATTELEAWTTRMRAALPAPTQQRAVAVYHPWLLAEVPSPSTVERYAATSPVGHVCGVIARLDRERGSGWSPANELVRDAIDVTERASLAEQAYAYTRQVNLLRCRVGGGLEIWGARTLDLSDGAFIAHRRVVHRLVRAMRRVTEPLVFDTNGPLLWFTVVRAVSGVLLEAFRAGALKGDSPDQAYRVVCDEKTNRPEDIDLGRVVCQVEVALAAPMEFITLRVTLGPQELLEVVEQGDRP